MNGVMWVVFASALGLLCGSPRAQEAPQVVLTSEILTVKKIFHIAGIPGQRRNERLSLILDGKQLVLRKKNTRVLELPYDRVSRVQMLSGERHYPEATYVAAVTTFGVGGLLLLKKRKMDTLVIDFVNERDGKMGLVLQLPLGEGPRCKQWLAPHGIIVDEPSPPPATPTKKP